MEAINITWAWPWRWGATAVILIMACLYGRGWRHGRAMFPQAASPVKPVLFACGMVLLAIAWLSPLNHLATQLFSARVVQRILLIGLVPFLVLLSNPVPVFFAALPTERQAQLQRIPAGRPRLWSWLVSATKPSIVWLFFVCSVWLWYDPQLHQHTLTFAWLHNLETTLLFLAALLYWWHILAVAPHLHQPMHPVVRIVYAIMGSGPVKFIGLILLFSNQTIYNYPASLQFDGLHMDDQSLGGMLIWTVGGIVFTWTAVYLIRQWLSLEEDKPYFPPALWSTEEAMLAPGFGKKVNPPH